MYTVINTLLWDIYDNVRCNSMGYGRLSKIKERIYVNDGEHINKKIHYIKRKINKFIHLTYYVQKSQRLFQKDLSQ